MEDTIIDESILGKEAEELVEELEEDYEQDDNIEYPDDLEPGSQLFPDGPTIEEINQWKAEYGEVYLTTINDDVFIWRPLARKELKEVHASASGVHQREETYCKMCNLWPADYDFADQNEKAGIPSVLSEQILLKSGFQATHAPIAL
jgi:hypothetical protein